MNGLRGIAALAVLTSHAWDFGTPDHLHRVNGAGRLDVGVLYPVFSLFGLGVALFFTLSGFLLYRRFAAAVLGASGRPSIRAYARARFLRIVPPYWSILLVTCVVFPAALVRTGNGGLALGHATTHPWTLLADVLFVQNYIPGTVLTGIGATWTLLNEAVFYLVLPLLSLPLIALSTRIGSSRGRLALALAAPVTLLAVGIASKGYGHFALGLTRDGGWDADWRSVFQRSFLYQADLFAAGMVAAALSVLAERGTLRVAPSLRRIMFAAAAAIFVVVPPLARHGMFPETFEDTIVSFSFGLLLLYLATVGDRRSALARLLQWRPLASVGLASYSIFLWHEPMIRWLNKSGLTYAGRGGLALNILILWIITLTLASLSYRFVERPCLDLRKRLERQSRVSPPVPAAQAASSA